MRTAAHVAKSGRSPRRVYSRPASDYQSSVAICGRRIVADGTVQDNRPLRAFSSSNNLLPDYVIGVSGQTLLFTGKLSPLAFIADFIEQFSQSGCATPSQNSFAVFRTAHRVVCSLVDRIAITNEFHCHHRVAQKRLLPRLKLGVSGARRDL